MVWGLLGWCQSKWYFGNIRELLTCLFDQHSKVGRSKVSFWFFHLQESFSVRNFPFVFLCCVFRGLSFALIVSMLRYWSVLLYILLILGSISLGCYFNREDPNFVTRGVKSVLSIGDVLILFWFNQYISPFSWRPIQAWDCLPDLLGNLQLPNSWYVDCPCKAAWYHLEKC